ncbi:hypothetical protein B0H17DRAFT_1288368, partial [Mycena rosella]
MVSLTSLTVAYILGVASASPFARQSATCNPNFEGAGVSIVAGDSEWDVSPIVVRTAFKKDGGVFPPNSTAEWEINQSDLVVDVCLSGASTTPGGSEFAVGCLIKSVLTGLCATLEMGVEFLRPAECDDAHPVAAETFAFWTATNASKYMDSIWRLMNVMNAELDLKFPETVKMKDNKAEDVHPTLEEREKEAEVDGNAGHRESNTACCVEINLNIRQRLERCTVLHILLLILAFNLKKSQRHRSSRAARAQAGPLIGSRLDMFAHTFNNGGGTPEVTVDAACAGSLEEYAVGVGMSTFGNDLTGIKSKNFDTFRVLMTPPDAAGNTVFCGVACFFGLWWMTHGTLKARRFESARDPVDGERAVCRRCNV